MISDFPSPLCAVQRLWRAFRIKAQMLKGASRSQGVDRVVLQEDEKA
jgi:hypothetical protein